MAEKKLTAPFNAAAKRLSPTFNAASKAVRPVGQTSSSERIGIQGDLSQAGGPKVSPEIKAPTDRRNAMGLGKSLHNKAIKPTDPSPNI